MTQGRIQREGEETNGGGGDEGETTKSKMMEWNTRGGGNRTAFMGRGGRRLGKRGRFSDGT